jgi:hypothetical protein
MKPPTVKLVLFSISPQFALFKNVTTWYTCARSTGHRWRKRMVCTSHLIHQKSELHDTNDTHGYDLRHGDFTIAVGREPEKIYSTTVHEAAHVRYDNMRHFGTEEENQKVAE